MCIRDRPTGLHPRQQRQNQLRNEKPVSRFGSCRRSAKFAATKATVVSKSLLVLSELHLVAVVEFLCKSIFWRFSDLGCFWPRKVCRVDWYYPLQNIHPTEMAYLVQDIKSSRNMPVWGENDVTGSKTKSTNAKKVRDDNDLQPQVRYSNSSIRKRESILSL